MKKIIFGVIFLTLFLVGCTVQQSTVGDTKNESLLMDAGTNNVFKSTEQPPKLTIPVGNNQTSVEQKPVVTREDEADSECPQFTEVKRSSNYEKVDNVWYTVYDLNEGTKDVDGWRVWGGYRDVQGGFADCREGSKPGENINYYYCGESQKHPLMAVKRITDSSGVIKETLKKKIIIVFDNKIVFDGKGSFVETICEDLEESEK